MKNLMHFFKKNPPLILFTVIVLFFFYPLILQGKIPIPADTIVGMFHPFRDVIWDNFTTGVPFKNFLITDPVRQQYPWRSLSMELIKTGQLPLWNPYSFSGTPLLSNFQSAVFYPLNILFFLLPFPLAWAILILLQPLLAGFFLYLYLRNFNVSKTGSIIGMLAFSFSGFFIAWLEWNTVIQTILWLPLILLSIERITSQNRKFIWSLIFIFSLSSSFFAGHLQVFFYSFLLILAYIISRIIILKADRFKIFLSFIFYLLSFIFLTSIQWLPTVQFILHSAREFDQGLYTKEGWFIPWQNLIQFLVPDFFGNPSTGNYWGVWNYGEFIGYIGILPLIFSIYTLVFIKSKKVLFFGCFLFLALLFSLPNFVSFIPYKLGLPAIATSQPTRLLSITVFCLSILAALGFDHLLKNIAKKESKKQILTILGAFFLTFLFLWIIIFANHLTISQRNLLLPTALFMLSSITLYILTVKTKVHLTRFAIYLIIFITIVDLLRFGWKFTPFSGSSWLYPDTKILDYLRTNSQNHRFLSIDRRIMPPNFSIMYKLQDVSGYDPLYLKRYGEFISAWERGKPDISPASFNRIITPTNISSPITNLLGIKYILSLDERKETFLKLVQKEGETRVYENTLVFPRAFFVSKVIFSKDDQDEIEKIYENINSLATKVTTQETINIDYDPIGKNESASIIKYGENQITLKTNSSKKRLLIITDIYYPTWKAYIDGSAEKIYKVDYTFRGIVVPPGKHTVILKDNLLLQ